MRGRLETFHLNLIMLVDNAGRFSRILAWGRGVAQWPQRPIRCLMATLSSNARQFNNLRRLATLASTIIAGP